jgi:hypothetical protein
VIALVLAVNGGAAALVLAGAMAVEAWVVPRLGTAWGLIEPTAWCVAGWLVFVFSRVDAANFVYQQF